MKDVEGGNEKSKKVWQSVGIRAPEKREDEVVVVKPSRREVLLEAVKQCCLDGVKASSEIFYVYGNGQVCDNVQPPSEVNSGDQQIGACLQTGAVTFVNTDGVLEDKAGSMQVNDKARGSWFEQSELGLDKEDREVPCDGLLSPRSSLKAIDEAMGFELFHLAERGEYDRGGVIRVNNFLEHSFSEDETGQGGVELAWKCYELDTELNIPLKKLRGVKKKKPIVILNRVTHLNKFY